LDSKPHKKEVIDMKTIKIRGKREPITMAEWKDIKKIVEKDLIKYKGFYKQLAEL